MNEYIFTESNMLKQLETAGYELGFYKLRFYTLNGKIAAEPTDVLSEFFLYPSGGTLRDSNFNIVFYSTRFDIYKGFRPPGQAADGE